MANKSIFQTKDGPKEGYAVTEAIDGTDFTDAVCPKGHKAGKVPAGNVGEGAVHPATCGVKDCGEALVPTRIRTVDGELVVHSKAGAEAKKAPKAAKTAKTAKKAPAKKPEA